jgi:hypothetical protein
LSNTGHPPSRGYLGEQQFSIRRSFVPELKRGMLLIDCLIDEANFAIVAVEGERSRHDSAARILVIRISHL